VLVKANAEFEIIDEGASPLSRFVRQGGDFDFDFDFEFARPQLASLSLYTLCTPPNFVNASTIFPDHCATSSSRSVRSFD
jgi:hypothetical protein